MADPQRAAAAVDELARLGVAALAGEYHSVVARAAAARADALGLPFLCSSAVLDALTEQPTKWVARLAPAQSHGWQIYAAHSVHESRRRFLNGWPKRPPASPSRYDTIAVLADVLRSHDEDSKRTAEFWPRVAVEGTRGLIQFSRVPGISVWQWAWAPIQVVDRDPAAPDRFRIRTTRRNAHRL